MKILNYSKANFPLIVLSIAFFTLTARAESQVQQLLKSFKALQNEDNNVEITLIDEAIDKWSVKFLYSENRIVHLKFEFSLIESLPPKITVVFPSTIRYVCFAEIGRKNWKSTNDLATLIFTLQNEYRNKAASFHESLKMSEAESDAQWKFVKTAHKDWDYVDITELTSNSLPAEVNAMRNEAKAQMGLNSNQNIEEESPKPVTPEQ